MHPTTLARRLLHSLWWWRRRAPAARLDCADYGTALALELMLAAQPAASPAPTEAERGDALPRRLLL